MNIPVILDTDLAMGAPGSEIDDGFALAMCLADPVLDLRLVTTVHGNTDVESATVLTLELLDRLGCSKLPVHRGADQPLARPRGDRGGGRAAVDVRSGQADRTAAVAAMIELVLAHPGEITLIAVGPLTNVAQAIRAEPRFASSLKALMIMGGLYLSEINSPDMPGEFNIWSDPEAAQIVLDSGMVASWVGLDVTRQVRLTRAGAASMAVSERAYESFAGKYTIGWIDHLAAQGDTSDSCALHDPLAVAAVSQPTLVTFAPAHVRVDTGDERRGVMITELGSSAVNARVGVAVDAGGFATHFRTLMSHL